MNLCKVLLILFLQTPLVYAVERQSFLVMADNGLFLREAPGRNSSIIGKLSFGTTVSIIEHTGVKETIVDNGKSIIGEWVKVDFQNLPVFVSNKTVGYVFSGYLKSRRVIIAQLTRQMSKFQSLDGHILHENKSPFFFQGDFFGDQVNDLVILVKDPEGATKVAFINYGKQNSVLFLGGEDDPFNIADYEWIGVFSKMKPGEALWSNYEENFIDYEDVPERKKVRLSYNALYLHAAESCGGGFIYWKNGKFNWLQQE